MHHLRHLLFALPALLWVVPVAAEDEPAARSVAGALTLVETGRAPNGKPRYSIEAYSVDLNTLITEVLRRTGEEFAVSQDVTGPVSLVLRNATADEILEAASRVARPPFRITRGRGIVVSLAPEAEGPVPPGGIRRITTGPGRRVGPSPTAIIDATSALQTPVSLDIADGRPVAMAQAMKALEQQTGVPIRLDPRIPGNLGFAARVTRTPLMVVLESIARTGALKWSVQSDGSVLVAPTDWMRLTLGGAPLPPAAASTPCPRCGRPIQPDWRYCPGCGQPIVRHGASSTRSAAP
jgi:hypothetical protein